MNLKRYNKTEVAIMQEIHDSIKYHLGEELNRDPYLDPEAMIEVEMRFAAWLINGGGEWLRNRPQVQIHLIEK